MVFGNLSKCIRCIFCSFYIDLYEIMYFDIKCLFYVYGWIVYLVYKFEIVFLVKKEVCVYVLEV